MLGMLGSSECCMPEALPRIEIAVRLVMEIAIAIAIRATTLPVIIRKKRNSNVIKIPFNSKCSCESRHKN